jgi:hypothetical protein
MTDDSTHRPRYAQVDREYGLRLATTEPADDGPVWMVNLMKYRDVADYADGWESIISGREADDLYNPIEVLNSFGADVVFVADVVRQPLGDSPTWDRIAVVKYPTRRSFIDMQSRADFQALHVHKDAGMEETIVLGCQPMPAPPTNDVDWADVPHPPTEDDGPVTVVHVIRFDNSEAAHVSPDDMKSYQSAAGSVAGPHGVRVDGWFAVEGTILGDGRAWHQVRFNTFPSLAAFMAVVRDPKRLDAERSHRQVAIADTYTMISRASINTLRDSV